MVSVGLNVASMSSHDEGDAGTSSSSKHERKWWKQVEFSIFFRVMACASELIDLS